MEKFNLTEALKELETINEWFEGQEEVDIEVGLEKVKIGVGLVKASRARLQEIENEFEEVKKELVQPVVSSMAVKAQGEDTINIDEIPF